MRTFGQMILKDYVLFKDATFDFSPPGVSVILGLNLNGANRSHRATDANTNFVGKSSLVGALADAFLKEGVTGRQKDKFRGGEVTVQVTDTRPSGKTYEYSVHKFYKGKTEKFRVERNGKDVTPEDSTDAQRRFIQSKVLGCDATTFNVINYLDNRQPHPIRTGDTGTRQAFFTSFFGLDAPDTIRSWVKSEKARLQSVAAVASSLREQIADSRKQLRQAGNLAELQASAKTLEGKVEELQDHISGLQKDMWYDSWLKSSTSQAVFALMDVLGTSDVAKLKARRAKLRALAELAEAREGYLTELRVWKRSKEKRKAALLEAGFETEEALTAHIEKINGRLERCQTILKDANKTLFVAQNEAAGANAKLESAERVLATKSRDLESLTGSPKNCPECGQPLTQTHQKDRVRQLKLEIQSLEPELESLRRKSRKAVGAVETAEAELEAAQSAIERHREKLSTRFPEVDEKPSEPQGADKLPEDFNAAANTKTLDDINTVLSFLRDPSYEHFVERWVSGDREPTGVTETVVSIETGRLTKVQSELAKAHSAIDVINTHRETLADLKARLEEAEKSAGDRDVLEVLDKAFNSGAVSPIKQMMVQAACRKLEERVNYFAATIFPETYRFEFDLSTQFTIEAVRSLKGRELRSDVRKLSGAESPYFDIALALALRSYQPESQRTNFLILDEMNANFGPELSDTFSSVLELINKVVPHVIVVTPRAQDRYPEGSRFFTVVKKGSWSTLQEGKRLK